MIAKLPDIVISTGSEDVQGVNGDINNLINKFIIPIDNIRSFSRPQLVKGNNVDDGFVGLEIDTIRPQESRAHAFMRYLGMPVAAPNTNKFYSPGFNPPPDINSDIKKNVDAKVAAAPFKKLINDREIIPQEYRKIFERQDTSSSILTLVLRNIRVFNILEKGNTKDPFDIFEQKFTIDKRSELINKFEKDNPLLKDNIKAASDLFTSAQNRLPVGAKFNGGQHILKPFTVDPRIANTVMPKKNIVCAPFLKDKTATKISKNTYLQRPGIELIIRERLKATISDNQFLQDYKKIISGESSPNVASESVDTQTFILTIFALADQNDIKDPNLTKTIQGLTSNQAIAIFDLIRTIKSLIGRLNRAISIIDAASSKINWIPIPSAEGPELGPRDAILDRSLATAQSDTDKRILALRINKAIAEAKKTEDTDLGFFASPFSATPQNSNLVQIDKNLKNEVKTRDKIANEAFIAMGELEIISGETTGLGLIDILAIYVALWAMDITCLLGLIDEDAFQRLKKYNANIANDSRLNNRNTDISACLQEFERNLVNVLSFVDKELSRQRGNPVDEDGGTPVQ